MKTAIEIAETWLSGVTDTDDHEWVGPKISAQDIRHLASEVIRLTQENIEIKNNRRDFIIASGVLVELAELANFKKAAAAAEKVIELFSDSYTSLNKREEARQWLSQYGTKAEGE